MKSVVRSTSGKGGQELCLTFTVVRGTSGKGGQELCLTVVRSTPGKGGQELCLTVVRSTSGKGGQELCLTVVRSTSVKGGQELCLSLTPAGDDWLTLRLEERTYTIHRAPELVWTVLRREQPGASDGTRTKVTRYSNQSYGNC